MSLTRKEMEVKRRKKHKRKHHDAISTPSFTKEESKGHQLLSPLKCPVCYEIFIHPVINTCGHTLCHICRNKIRIVHESCDIKCPICNTKGRFNITNFVLDNLIQLLPSYQKRIKTHAWYCSLEEMINHCQQFYKDPAASIQFIYTDDPSSSFMDKHGLVLLNILYYLLENKLTYEECLEYLQNQAIQHVSLEFSISANKQKYHIFRHFTQPWFAMQHVHWQCAVSFLLRK